MQVLILISAFIPLTYCLLPSFWPTCPRDPNTICECIVAAAKTILDHISKGYGQFNIPAVTPYLNHPGATYTPNSDFSLEIKNTRCYGIDAMEIVNASVNFEEKTISLSFICKKQINWRGYYVATDHVNHISIENRCYFIFSKRNKKTITLTYDVEGNIMSIINVAAEFTNTPIAKFYFKDLEKHESILSLWEESEAGFADFALGTCATFIKSIWDNVCLAATFDEIFPPVLI